MLSKVNNITSNSSSIPSRIRTTNILIRTNSGCSTKGFNKLQISSRMAKACQRTIFNIPTSFSIKFLTINPNPSVKLVNFYQPTLYNRFRSSDLHKKNALIKLGHLISNLSLHNPYLQRYKHLNNLRMLTPLLITFQIL